MRDFKRKSLSLIKKGGIGALSSLLLPIIVFAVTTIGSNVTTDGHVLPGSNNASDFGAYGTAFRDIYASGTFRNQVLFNAGNFNASGTSYLSHAVAAHNNAWDLGSGTSSWRNVYASGTFYLNTSLLSSTNNTLDLGAFGNAVNDVFASGTVYSATHFNSGEFNSSGTTRLGFTVPANNNAWDLGSATSSWRDVYASGTHYGGGFNASSTSYLNNVIPAAINTYDLGASSTPWRSISASTSIRLGRQAASTTLGLASNSAVTDKGQGTCIVLRAADGTLVYLSATSTQSASAPWTALVVSTESCE